MEESNYIKRPEKAKIDIVGRSPLYEKDYVKKDVVLSQKYPIEARKVESAKPMSAKDKILSRIESGKRREVSPLSKIYKKVDKPIGRPVSGIRPSPVISKNYASPYQIDLSKKQKIEQPSYKNQNLLGNYKYDILGKKPESRVNQAGIPSYQIGKSYKR